MAGLWWHVLLGRGVGSSLAIGYGHVEDTITRHFRQFYLMHWYNNSKCCPSSCRKLQTMQMYPRPAFSPPKSVITTPFHIPHANSPSPAGTLSIRCSSYHKLYPMFFGSGGQFDTPRAYYTHIQHPGSFLAVVIAAAAAAAARTHETQHGFALLAVVTELPPHWDQIQD